MHWIRRPLWILNAILLLLLLGGWMRSVWVCDSITWTDSQHFVTVLSSGGRLNLTHSQWPNATAWSKAWTASSVPRTDPSNRPRWETDRNIHGRRRWLGFEWSKDLSPWPSNQTIFLSFYLPPYRLIAVPYWATAVFPAISLAKVIARRLRYRSRLRGGRCPDCGYDLRGSPGRCPECGWASAAPPLASDIAPTLPM